MLCLPKKFSECPRGDCSTDPSPHTLGNVPECVWGGVCGAIALIQPLKQGFLKRLLHRPLPTHSGTFPSVCGGSVEQSPRGGGGLLPRISPKVSLPEKNSGTFPSLFGDCFRGFHLKSASPKTFPSVFGDCFRGFPLKSASRTKNSGTFPSVFGDCSREFPKVSLPKKIRERSRVSLGTASEDFP